MLPTPTIPSPDYERIYEPAEDSFLILDLFESQLSYFQSKRFSKKTPLVLEIGTGSGIITTFINKHILPNAIYVASDLNPYACKTALRTNKANASSINVDSIRCDLTTALLPNSVDLLVFNPPYVPAEFVPQVPETSEDEHTWVDIALNGGPEGMDVTNQLLQSLSDTLSVDGEAYILFCARNNPDTVAQNFMSNYPNFKVERVIHRKAGWEVLSIYRFLKLS
ncbi:hypothetical protein CANARDRAFT_194525 [[Candida] arabinofermentans NRRL YB-2248]|uniref:Methyltransferase small domain-containing protein n=1 Tax=[Candida] arabinofermentans NRRL YB-2248 TaxID=983967 RepID=A0A1E4T6W5_9ASCO|nr:hypothetical protein CANARDRAFT_194525 [[Candida] arabinofermentans NRRL YB-2248]